MTMRYLDHNASAPLLPEARSAMLAALDVNGNASSVHRSGRALRAMVQKARRQVAGLVGAEPDHVVFTSGATEAAATLLTPGWSMGRAPLTMGRLFVGASDHPCLLAGGRFSPENVTRIGVNANGLIDLAALERALAAHDRGDGTPLVALHWVNNETGVIQPVAEIGALARKAGAVLVLDAVQALGRIPVDVAEGYADFLIVSSHKIGGPKGAGAIVARSDLMMPMPLMGGGGQERGHRAGTEAVANIAGFGAAAQAAAAGLDAFAALADRRDRFEHALCGIAPDAIVHGAGAPRVANTSFFSVPGVKAETLAIGLDLAGFAVSSGSACSSGKVGRSHVLEAMGSHAREGAVRVSIGPSSAADDLDALGEALAPLIGRMRAA
ncbi:MULTISPECIES: cysteine desulfurase family protein [unclassified Roseitalea]|uniref:cysteine desulfurase family protein n=1 Tax=unclassified Roseitalea TaxID=2639107 RepID=UPI00273E0448|nr:MULTISPECIES: cysteine desulfurase family protein [unclassified Roseitalea]